MRLRSSSIRVPSQTYHTAQCVVAVSPCDQWVSSGLSGSCRDWIIDAPSPCSTASHGPAAWVVTANHNPAHASECGAMLEAIKDKLDPGACRWNFVCEQHPGSLCTNASWKPPNTSRRRRNGLWEGQYHSGIIVALLFLQVG